MQTNSKVGNEEKLTLVERPLTGSSLAAMAYGTSSGLFLKRSVLSSGFQDDQGKLKKKDQNFPKKIDSGSLSSRTHKPNQENGSIFVNSQSEYERNTVNGQYFRNTEEYMPTNLASNPLLTKARLSKPELKDKSSKTSRVSLHNDYITGSKGLQTSGALTDRTTYREPNPSQIGQKANVLVRVNTANLVQASKFTKHITQNTQEKPEEKNQSGMGKKISSKLIIIGEDKIKKGSLEGQIDFLSNRTRKSAINLTESKPSARGLTKPQDQGKPLQQKKEIKSILEEINLMKGRLDRSSDRPASNNKHRKSPLNKKPIY